MVPRCGKNDPEDVGWVGNVLVGCPTMTIQHFLARITAIYVYQGIPLHIRRDEPYHAPGAYGIIHIYQHAANIREAEMLDNVVAIYVIDTIYGPRLQEVQVMVTIEVGINPAGKFDVS